MKTTMMTRPTTFLLILVVLIIGAVHSQDDNVFDSDNTINDDPYISLEEALLADLVPDHDDPSSCSFADESTTASTTSWTFTFPGTNPNSKWNPDFSMYEAQLFLAEMTHTDPSASHRNWTMRIGRGSNIYSFYAPELYGEAMPPQYHNNAPWIDEVLQSVSVSQSMNDPANGRAYFIHQAGAYQGDPEYTGSAEVAGDPFFSPNVAKFCRGNTCTFASWGQQAHVPTQFASKLLYVNRYRNCGKGVVEVTQTFQNFARSDGDIKRPGYDESLTHFDVPWGGVRTSHLPDVIEPDIVSGRFEIDPRYGDVRTPINDWGVSHQVGTRGMVDLRSTGGFTTFVGGYWPNKTVTPLDLPCVKQDMGMVVSCTDEQIQTQNYRRMVLQVPSSGTNCFRHGASTPENLLVGCFLHPPGFGQNFGQGENSGGSIPFGPYQFVNSATGARIIFRDILHWSWGDNSGETFFSTFYNDTAAGLQQAQEDIAAAFPPGSTIEAFTHPTPLPENYDAEILPSLTIVYGTGEEYLETVPGRGRRRLGSGGGMPRDYTVFAINHYLTRLQPGQTYLARQYLVSEKLGSVDEIANALVDETYMAQIDDVDYNGRPIQLYTNDDEDQQIFGAAASATVGGIATSCDQGRAVCNGWTTPGTIFRSVPFFYITGCGPNRTYFGPDMYFFMPGRNHSQDIVDHDGVIRAYACEGEPPHTRPSFRLIGYFNPADASCASLQNYTYSPSYCQRRGAGMDAERGTAPTTNTSDANTAVQSEQSDDGGNGDDVDDFYTMDLLDPEPDVPNQEGAEDSAPSQPPDPMATSSGISTGPSVLLQTILAVHQLVRLAGHTLQM